MNVAFKVYYFSGTGNSLHVARSIAGEIGGKTVNMAGLMDQAEVTDDSDSIGFVFPVYFSEIPDNVRSFVRKVRLTGKPYVFAVATCGMMPGNALFSLGRELKEKGIELSAGFSLVMPDNAYVKMNFITPPEQRDAMLRASETKLSAIIKHLSVKEKTGIEGKKSLSAKAMCLAMKTMSRGMHRQFRATDKCTGCGTCKNICPTGNIRVDGKKVTWGDHCDLCLACFHWCPAQSVQIGGKTENIVRYHHPMVTVRDMAGR